MARVYIAGPMRGHSDLNFHAFDAARDGLILCGHTVSSPVDNDRRIGISHELGEVEAERLFWSHRAYMWDLEQVAECDAIYMLKGWESSSGARAEHAVAVWLKKEIWYEDSGV